MNLHIQVHRYCEPGQNRWGRRDSCVISFEHPLPLTSCSRQEKHLPPPQGYTGTSRIVPHNQLLIEISVLKVRRCDFAQVGKVDLSTDASWDLWVGWLLRTSARRRSTGPWWMTLRWDNSHDLYILHHLGINNAWRSTLLSAITMFHIESWKTTTVHSPSAFAFQFCLSTRAWGSV